jgi:hypothetical protein
MALTNEQIGARYLRYLDWWVQGPKEDLVDLYDSIAEAERTGFPWEPAVIALACLEDRRLWKTFGTEELQDLYDWANEAELPADAERFMDAEKARPYMTTERYRPT